LYVTVVTLQLYASKALVNVHVELRKLARLSSLFNKIEPISSRSVLLRFSRNCALEKDFAKRYRSKGNSENKKESRQYHEYQLVLYRLPCNIIHRLSARCSGYFVVQIHFEISRYLLHSPIIWLLINGTQDRKKFFLHAWIYTICLKPSGNRRSRSKFFDTKRRSPGAALRPSRAR